MSQRKIFSPIEEYAIRKIISIPYITKENRIDERPIQLFLPKAAKTPMPLIFAAHYELPDDTIALHAYLQKGWAVAAPTAFREEYQGQLVADNLIFNNATFCFLRQLPEIDKSRIALLGNSAGGYTALMLTALHTGICCTVVNSPLANLYFNFHHYLRAVKALCEPFRSRNSSADTGQTEQMPLPIVSGVFQAFQPVLTDFPNPDDISRWEAFSPSALTELFGNPILLTHFTSDVLVPIDQISKRYTYPHPGKSLPQDFAYRLSDAFLGKLSRSLEEGLPSEQTQIFFAPAPKGEEDVILPYAASKRFNLNLYDDGPTESHGEHRTEAYDGFLDNTSYFEEMFSRTSAETDFTTPQKLQLLLERYHGNSLQLPPHENIDDTVYGSLAIYRREVCEELSYLQQLQGEKAFESATPELQREIRILLSTR